MKWRWLVVALPALLGFGAAAVLNNSDTLNSVFAVTVSLSVLAWMGGLALSLLLVLALAVWEWGLIERQEKVRWALRDQQAQTAADRRRFLQRLDHELKNPLTAIRAGLANFANAPTPEARHTALTSVEAQTVRLSRLTADLRKIAELETRSLELSAIDLTQLLQEAVTLAKDRPGVDKRRLALTVPKAPWPLPPVSADWDLIFLAVYNLLENALKFTRPGDTIEIRAREDNRMVVIEVADTGPGIREDEIAHVWEELYRGQGGRRIPGSGLGLALVKAVAERHGGQVMLDSRSGRGTVVAMKLPVMDDKR